MISAVPSAATWTRDFLLGRKARNERQAAVGDDQHVRNGSSQST